MLKGKILTPIVSKKSVFEVEECRAVILNPKRRYITKSHKLRRIHPFCFTGFLGTIKLTYRCQTLQKAKAKLRDLLKIENIGRFWREGLGRVEWISGNISKRIRPSKKRIYGQVKIRKGLPHQLSEFVKRLLHYAILHDFVHTSMHQSKIYVQVEVDGLEDLQKHHEPAQNLLIQTFQRYDQIAARITRKIRSPRTNRYTWEAKGNIDFKRLAEVLVEHEKNIWRLYQCIYNSRELQQINESFEYGHSSLKEHLLLIVNLIVQDHLRGKL